MNAHKLDPLVMAYAKAADGIGCERGSHLYDEIVRGLTAVLPMVAASPPTNARETIQLRGYQVMCDDMAPEFDKLLKAWLGSDMLPDSKERAGMARFLWDNKVGLLRTVEFVRGLTRHEQS